jgi:glycerol dehydrogenase
MDQSENSKIKEDMIMAKILNSPSKYIQGAGELSRIGSHVKSIGTHALVLISASGLKRSGDDIRRGFEDAGMPVDFEVFNGECSKPEINRVMDVVKKTGSDVIIGVGGGKVFDTSKATAFYLKMPVVICPTVAASDAPCSALSVIYTPEGVFDEYLFLPANPNMVIMDTAVIAKSPVRLTISGIGDALATYFEARACLRKNADTCAGGKATLAGMALAELCLNTLLAEGEKAKVALQTGSCTQAVEKIVEANTLLSGLGFESGGLAAAHAIHNGLTVLEECHHMYHGEKVAFGTLVQLILEDAPLDELEKIAGFCVRIGLPVTMEQLGVKELTREKAMAVAKTACAENDTMGNMPFTVTPEAVCDAIITADAYGHSLLAKA